MECTEVQGLKHIRIMGHLGNGRQKQIWVT